MVGQKTKNASSEELGRYSHRSPINWMEQILFGW